MKIFILLITNFPLFFIIIYLLSFLLIKNKKNLFTILIFNSIAMVLFLFPISSILLEKPLYPKKNIYESEKEYSLILVPTAGIVFNEDKKEMQPTENSINRIKATFNHTNKLDLPIIISGGRTKKKYKSEANIIFNKLKSKYFLNKNVILEENSINTFETSKNIKKYLENNKLSNDIILITDLYHYKRMSKSLKKSGINPFFPREIFKKKIITSKSFIPSFKNFSKINNIKYEYFGLIYYKILGRI